MKLARYFAVALACALTPSCFIYDPSLLDDGSGGSGGTGSTNGGGGETDGGGTGNSTNGGGTGGTGGNTGGGGSGNSPNGGGTDGGGGTGGGGVVSDLVDDFSSESLIYDNDPFSGQWARAQQADATWDPTNILDMVTGRADDTANFALHAKANAPNETGVSVDWGGEVYAQLGGTAAASAVDLSSYTHLVFSGLAIDSTTRIVKISLEDVNSNYNLCNPSCPPHAAVTVQLGTPASGWRDYEIELSDFVRTTPPFAVDQVHAIHFGMDPTMNTVMDFWIDDIRFETRE